MKKRKQTRSYDWSRTYFIVHHSYGQLERGDDIEFFTERTERMANIRVKRATKSYGFKRRNWNGNMHADTSHLDFEVHKFFGINDFQKFCKESKFKINWEDRNLTPQEDIGVTVSTRDYNLIRSGFKDHDELHKVLLKFVKDLKQEAKRKMQLKQKENSNDR